MFKNLDCAKYFIALFCHQLPFSNSNQLQTLLLQYESRNTNKNLKRLMSQSSLD